MTTHPLKNSNRGWWVVAGLLAILTLGSGFGFYNLSVYMNALAEERGFSIASLSFAISLFFLAGGAGGLWVARLIERFDLRWIMTAGALVSGLALALAGSAGSAAQLLWIYALFGFANACLSLVPMTAVVARWFPGTNRSIALATASTGLSLGGVVITPATVSWIEAQGIEAALLHFGVVYGLLLLPLIWGLVRLPESQAVVAGEQSPDVLGGWDYREAVRSRFFILVTAAYFLLMGAQVGGIAHLFNQAAVVTNREIAAVAVQLLAIASISGRLVGGWLLRFVPTRGWLIANAVGQALGLYLLAQAASAPGIWAGAVLFGLTVGNLLMLQPLVLVEAFGARSYARIYALSYAMSTVGVASGPLLLGLLYEQGGYGLAYGVASVLSVTAFAVLLATGELPDSRESVTV